MSKVTPFLMFNDQLEAAMAFYTATFPDSEIKNVARTGQDGPITSAEFVVGGQSLGHDLATRGDDATLTEGVDAFFDTTAYSRSFIHPGPHPRPPGRAEFPPAVG